MNVDLSRLLKEALLLPPEARGALASHLIDSLDAKLDPDIEAAWDAEISRREQELDSGKVRAMSWAEARREILRAPRGPSRQWRRRSSRTASCRRWPCRR